MPEAEGEDGMGHYCLMGTVSVWKAEKFLEMDNDDGYKTVRLNLIPLNCIHKDG